jgi:hypothetical protein
MKEVSPNCPNCGASTTLVRVPTRVKRGDKVLSVPLESWECTGACRSEERPFVFSNQALAGRNDAHVRRAWHEAFGEEIPEPKRPGRKPQEPRVRTVQVKLSENELRELDAQRGALTRSEYLRTHGLPSSRRSA